MKKTKTLITTILIAVSAVCSTGFANESIREKMLGTWKLSEYFDASDLREFSNDPIMSEAEMTIKGTVDYHRGGKYNSEARFTLRMNTTEGEISLKFMMRESGEWTLYSHGKELTETTVDATFAPLDDFTKFLLEESPGLAASLKPIRGETSTSKILSISDRLLEIETDDPKLHFVLKKH